MLDYQINANIANAYAKMYSIENKSIKSRIVESAQPINEFDMSALYQAGMNPMGNPMFINPYKPGTDEIKDGKELKQEQKNTAIGGAIGIGAGLMGPAAASMGPVGSIVAPAVGGKMIKTGTDELSKDLDKEGHSTAAGVTRAVGNVAQAVGIGKGLTKVPVIGKFAGGASSMGKGGIVRGAGKFGTAMATDTVGGDAIDKYIDKDKHPNLNKYAKVALDTVLWGGAQPFFNNAIEQAQKDFHLGGENGQNYATTQDDDTTDDPMALFSSAFNSDDDEEDDTNSGLLGDLNDDDNYQKPNGDGLLANLDDI